MELFKSLKYAYSKTDYLSAIDNKSVASVNNWNLKELKHYLHVRGMAIPDSLPEIKSDWSTIGSLKKEANEINHKFITNAMNKNVGECGVKL